MVKQKIGLSEGFHITICFDTKYEQRWCPKYVPQLSTQDEHKSWYKILKPNCYGVEPNHQEFGGFLKDLLKDPAQKWINTIERRTCIHDKIWKKITCHL